MSDEGLEYFVVSKDQMYGKFLAKDIIIAKTGEVLAEAGDEINEDLMNTLTENKIKSVETLFIDDLNVGPYIRNTLAADKINHVRKLYLIFIA